MSTAQIVKWAAGFTVGVGVIVWLNSTFLTKETFNIYLGTLHSDIRRLEAGQEVILRKVENIEEMVRRQRTSASLPRLNTNLYASP